MVHSSGLLPQGTQDTEFLVRGVEPNEATMRPEDFRRIALALPEAEEKSHFGKPDFRVRNRIFAGLPPGGHAVLKLTPEEQTMLTEAEPAIFRPVKGGWGRQGWTEMDLSTADETTLRSACLMAWRNVAPISLRKRQAATGEPA